MGCGLPPSWAGPSWSPLQRGFLPFASRGVHGSCWCFFWAHINSPPARTPVTRLVASHGPQVAKQQLSTYPSRVHVLCIGRAILVFSHRFWEGSIIFPEVFFLFFYVFSSSFFFLLSFSFLFFLFRFIYYTFYFYIFFISILLSIIFYFLFFSFFTFSDFAEYFKYNNIVEMMNILIIRRHFLKLTTFFKFLNIL